MKRSISVVLALILLFSLAACGSSPVSPSPDTSGSQVPTQSEQDLPKETDSPQKPEDPSNEDPTQQKPNTPPAENIPQEPILPPAEPAAPRVTHLQIMKGAEFCDRWDDDFHLLVSAEWEEIAVVGDDPVLTAALEQLNSNQMEIGQHFLQEWLPLAREARAQAPEYFGGFTCNSQYTIRRADSLVLSIREDFDSYTGGVHPNYAVAGLNFDTATGERLKLTDVLTSTDGLAKILAGKIREKYPGVPFFGLDETLVGYTPEHYTWTLGYQGMTFYFSPYEIAPYAAGLLTATIWFDEMPELFREEYTATPADGYIMALPDWNEIEVDLSVNDDRRDTLSVSTRNGEYGEVYLTMTLNGQEYTEKDWCAFDIYPHLVCTGKPGNERFYLYVEAAGENNFRTIYVYDLNNGMPKEAESFPGVGRLTHWEPSAGIDGIHYYEVLNTPTEFPLQTKCNLLGSKMVFRKYTIRDHGVLAALSDVYTASESLLPITSAIPLEVLILPQNTTETLPAGTSFTFLQTDNETYADLRIRDGRECRITIKEIDWTPTINGIPEWDCFTDLIYAD